MDEKDKRIQELERIVEIQAALIQKLEARIAELERRLGLDSSNSSKPPSSDGLGKKSRSLRVKGKNPSGGQKGHKGHTLIQVLNPDQIIGHKIDHCEVCQVSLEDIQASRVIKRQVFDVPEPRIEITEHQAEVKLCACGHMNRATFPEDIQSPVQYGPRVKALAVYFSAQQFIPEDRLQSVFLDLFSLSISTATLASINGCGAQINAEGEFRYKVKKGSRRGL